MRTCAAFLLVLSLSCTPERVSTNLAANTQAAPTPAEQVEKWSSIGIVSREVPEWLFVRKVGWRSGPESLVLPGSDPDVRKLQGLLAGNRRLDYLCGYHWSFDFSFPDGRSESLLINEECESFEKNGKEVWAVLSNLFARARNHPSHYLLHVVVRHRNAKGDVRNILERRFGPTLDPDPSGVGFFVASGQPWSSERTEFVRASSEQVSKVEQIPVSDLGN